MAQKRMFDKKIVCSDKFIDLPNSTKALYFMAGMDADDKGFFQPRKLQRLCGFSEDDFKILLAKDFFINFPSGVMVVTDWNKNNWLDSRRITQTEYINELNSLKLTNQKYEFITSEDNAKPMLRENSIEENSIEYISTTTICDEPLENTINEQSDDNNLFSYLEQAWGRTLGPVEYEIISSWEDNEITRYAIKESIKANVRNIKYIEAIVDNLKAKGIKTEADAIAERDNFKLRQLHRNQGNKAYKSSGDKLKDLENKILEESNG